MVDLFEGTIAFELLFARCTLKETWTWPLQQKTTTAMSLTKDRNEAKYRGQPVFVDLLRSSPRTNGFELFRNFMPPAGSCHNVTPSLLKRVHQTHCLWHIFLFFFFRGNSSYIFDLSKILNVPFVSSNSFSIFTRLEAFLKSCLEYIEIKRKESTFFLKNLIHSNDGN